MAPLIETIDDNTFQTSFRDVIESLKLLLSPWDEESPRVSVRQAVRRPRQAPAQLKTVPMIEESDDILTPESLGKETPDENEDSFNILEEDEDSFKFDENSSLFRESVCSINEPMDESLLPADVKDFQKHSPLGEGSFGQVWLVTCPKIKSHRFALKIQAKHELLADGNAWAAKREKQILAELQHPFINRLYKTYQDDDFLYSLLDFIQGGELFTVMHDDGEPKRLPETQAKFYALAIADALAYMHSRSIVYRDMKPENVMIDQFGYPIIIDFGLAKKIDGKTFTLCGTPRYMAPEMVMSTGHDCTADNWSLGILIYEMVTAQNPFYFEGLDDMMLYHSIVNDPYEPPIGVSAEVDDIISKLLTKDAAQRLGSERESDICDHPWFDSLDLPALRRRESGSRRRSIAPWIPRLQDDLDCSRFLDFSETCDKSTMTMPQISVRDQLEFDGF